MKNFKLLTLVSICGIACGANLRAQALLYGTGGIDLKGGSSFTYLTQSGAANRFLWDPDKGALVFGNYLTTPGSGDIGMYSFSGGYRSQAKGDYSFAYGDNALAEGPYSLAFGSYAYTGGSQAIALTGGAIGGRSVAIGGYAAGPSSVAVGASEAYGWSSVAIGYGVTTRSTGGIAVGLANVNVKKDGVTAPIPDTPTMEDPLFEVGNGNVYDLMDSEGINLALPRSNNAFTIFRDGTIRMGRASGGISMGQFSN